MYLIKNKTGKYLKLTVDNKITFTSIESLADIFPSERESIDFIRKAFNKKSRRNYKVVQCGEGFVSDLTPYQAAKKEETADRYKKGIDSLSKAMSTYFTPEIEKQSMQLQQYDQQILDIRHYIRNEDTKLNACQGYMVFKKLQQIERERGACKKELQRVMQLCNSIKKAVKDSESFEYEEYKNRQIENVAEFIFGE